MDVWKPGPENRRADLMLKGIGPYDILITGLEVARSLVLVVDKVKEFRRIENPAPPMKCDICFYSGEKFILA